MFRILRVLLLAIVFGSPVCAHDNGALPELKLPSGFRFDALMVPDEALGLAQLRIETEPDGRVAFRARLSGPAPAQTPIWPAHCAVLDPLSTEQLHDGWRLTETRHCVGAQGAMLLPWPVEGAQVIVARNSGEEAHFLRAGISGVALPMEMLVAGTGPLATIAPRYLAAGVLHILGGADHLALILCLLLLAHGRLLVLAVTAFTLGHSLSLALGTLELVRVPAVPVEACIALSIVFLARQAVLGHGLRDRDLLPLVGIGMLHGLGFAGMLSELGLPPGQFLLALLSFNLGIEAGQLAFLAVLAIGWRLSRSVAPTIVGFGRALIAPTIGTLAALWTLERLTLLG